MIISVHLPKTAGTSFIKTLKLVYGNKLMVDYADTPINTTPFKRKATAFTKNIKNRFKDFKEIECIHGHFMPYKYASIRSNVIYITWLRDPVERLASHYYYWKNNYNENHSFSLHKRVVEENWSLEKFAFSKEIRNIYSKFLWRFPLNKFHFIGITEYYEEDLKYFSTKYFNRKLEVFKDNRNTERSGLYIKDKLMRREIEKFHEKDMEIYQRALALRNQRISY